MFSIGIASFTRCIFVTFEIPLCFGSIALIPIENSLLRSRIVAESSLPKKSSEFRECAVKPLDVDFDSQFDMEPRFEVEDFEMSTLVSLDVQSQSRHSFLLHDE